MLRAWWVSTQNVAHWYSVATAKAACGDRFHPVIEDLSEHSGNHWSRWQGWKVCMKCRRLDPNS